jgi:hypothetical protein
MQRRESTRSASIVPSTLVLLPLLGFAGCGEEAVGPPREAVSGTVSLDGRPLPDGVIQLIPTSAREGTMGGASVKDGRFSIKRHEGLAPGGYRVVIHSSVGGGDASRILDEAPGLLSSSDSPRDLIPAQYNTNSTLKAEIKAGTANTLDFSLKSK